MKFLFVTKNNPILVTIVLVLVLNGTVGYGQSIFSTYSRFGVGIPARLNSMTHFGMGGASTALTDLTSINLNNPASYSFNGITSMQVSIAGSRMQSSTANSSAQYNNAQIREIALLFKKPGSKWAFAAGLNPYSEVNYSLSQSAAVNDSLTAQYQYSGIGGLNKMTVGSSRVFTIYKKQTVKDSLGLNTDVVQKIPIHHISVGLNVNSLFGSITHEGQTEFKNATYYNTKQVSKLNNRGAIFDLGVLYRVRISKKEENGKTTGDSHLFIAADYNTTAKLHSRYTEQNTRYIYNGSVAVSGGTTYDAEEIKGKTTIPGSLSLGIAYRKSGKKWGRYTVAADYKTQDWSDYNVSFDSPFSQKNYLSKSSAIALGAEYEPSIASKDNFLHRMSYRAGVRQVDTHLKINGTSVSQQAVSLGVSIPVTRSLSKLHLGAEYMTNGSVENNLILEKGFNFMVGFTLTPSERWFFQRKYD